ncbi:MAG: ribosome recycling factor [Gemmatimonadetes bacterium]|jgi:ribosome recycling factor|nr:ribosome recycling factor [Gemmatimonadota bacterium]
MIDEILQEVKAAMKKGLDALRRDLAGIRTGRASTAMLDHVRIEYYGNQTPLNQAATISVPEPRLIVIKPWEQNLIPVIEKAILADSSLGLNPSNDGTIIRLPIPELTEERRIEITKVARHRGEDGKVAIRHARRDGLDLTAEAQKDGEVSEDEARHGQSEIQKLTDEYVVHIDEIIKHKEAEIMEV